MKRPRYPGCIFCEQTDSEPSKEDVIPKWIAREFPGRRKSSFVARTGAFGDANWPTHEFDTVGHFGWVTTGPCKRCNNGWMSELETLVRPILRPLMHGQKCTLSSADLTVLARWVFKTTLMWEYMRYESGRFFTRRHRRTFFQSRAIPDDTFIWATRYVGTSATHSFGGPLILPLPDTSAEVRGYAATHAVGQVALQILCFRNPGNLDATIRIPPRHTNHSKPVWPMPFGWSWPPPRVLDDDGLVRFATRVAERID